MLAPEGIANELARIAKHPYVVSPPAGHEVAATETASPASADAAAESADRERAEVTAQQDDASALTVGRTRHAG